MTESPYYAVPMTKLEPLSLAPHPDACETVEELEAYVKTVSKPLAADLFCGAGGFSLGLDDAGFATVVGIDYEDYPVETFRNLFPGLVLKRDLSDDAVLDEVSDILERIGITALVGGPPCQPFSRAGRATLRSLVERGVRDPYDHRRDLWESFLEIAARVQPPIVMMENVPDLALSDNGIIMRLLVEALEQIGYAVSVRLVDAWRYGIPQHRKRVILVALHGARHFEWPKEAAELGTVAAAIDDLPAVHGGWDKAGGTHGFLQYDGPRTTFQERARRGVAPEHASRIYDHVTRAVRPDDAIAFAQMDATTTYSDLDDELKRYRDDIFDDKYNRLDANDVSRTIIAHLAKDGYGFIHPTQDRTITIREAARLQTFPDRVRFAGPPTAALRQIGNAVPPMLGEQIAAAALESLNEPADTGYLTRPISQSIAAWYRARGPRSQPWLGAKTTWPMLLGDSLLFRADLQRVSSMWPVLASFDKPDVAVARSTDLRRAAGWIDRADATDSVLAMAEHFAKTPDDLSSLGGLMSAPGMAASPASLIALASPQCDDDVLFSDRGVLRVVARFFGTSVDRANQRSDGRVETARLVGVGEDSREANLGLVELARSLCTPATPRCPECPLVDECAFALETGRSDQAMMF